MRLTPRLLGATAATVTTAVVGAVLPATVTATAQAAPPGPAGPPAPASSARPPAAAPGAQPAAEQVERPAVWRRAQGSVRTSAADVVAERAPRAGRRTRLRVVTVQDVGGAPTIEVERVRGRHQAVASVDEAQRLPGVVAVDVDTRVRAAGTVVPITSTGGSDPGRSQQWGLDRLDADSAWDVTAGGGVVVAVVDSGVDGGHPDLAGRLTTAGYDFVTGGGDGRVDENNHGTHVAGVIAAVRGNSVGVAGLAPRARIMPIRVLDAQGSGWSSDIARGITYAVDHGAEVINLSLGGPHQDSVTASAVEYALSKGVTVVAAAGNERKNGSPTTYPAAYPGVVAVASIDKGDGSSPFSNTGAYVDLAAPGGRILSTVVDGYGFMSGTSMAAPFVSATAALAVDAARGDTADVVQAMIGTAADLGPDGRDDQFGHGLVSPSATLRAVSAADEQPPASTQPAVERGESPARQRLRLTFTSRGGRALVGRHRAVRVHVADVADGSPVADQRVLLRGHRGGKVVLRRWVRTGAHGNAGATFRIRATTRFSLRSPETPSTAAARSERGIRWRAAPRVRSNHTDRRATVRVLDDRGQRVVFQRARGARWVRVAVRRLDGRGRAVVRRLPRGRVRARVTRAPGLVPVRTRPWRVG
jgi:serine protease